MQQYINRVAVVGSGVMGAAIAAHIAGAGISVTLLDVVPTELTPQEAKRGLTLESPAVRNRLAQAGKDRILDPKAKAIFEKGLGNLITVGNLEDDMDSIREVIVERLDIKRTLFEKIGKVRKPGSIVSTKTSGISIEAIVEGMPAEFRQHFIGTHFFNPPRFMKLLELIPAADCKPEVRAFMKRFMERTLGKTVIMCKDTPGFIANRVGTFASIAGLQMIEKCGFNLAEIDQITGPVLGRPKTGTFRLMDMVGLDVAAFVSQNIIDNVDDASEKEALALPAIHHDLVKRNHLGDKTGQGYYKRVKTRDGAVNTIWDMAKGEYAEPTVRELPAVQRAAAGKTLGEKLNALLYVPEEDGKAAWEITKATLLYAARKAEEISFHYRDIDTALECGYNWEYGPFRLWDAIGLEKSVARMKAEGETIPAWVEARLQRGDFTFIKDDVEIPYIDLGRQTFEVVKENATAAICRLADDVLLLKLKTKANTVDQGAAEMLLEAASIVEQGYAGLVIANGGKNFSAGANLADVAALVQAGNLAAIEKQVDAVQAVNMAIKYCKRPVVAAPFGQTLGGGAEIVLHAGAAAAAAETYMGLPEVGVGLVPAGGGIKELLYRYMEYAEKAPKANAVDFVAAAWDVIAMGKVSGSAHEAVKWSLLRPTDSISLGQEYIVEKAKEMVLHLSEQGYLPPVRRDIRVTGETGRGALLSISANMRNGNFITDYDAHVANKIAYIITGGDAAIGAAVPEEHFLKLEKEVFMSLITEEKTQQRISHMLKTGKRLSN